VVILNTVSFYHWHCDLQCRLPAEAGEASMASDGDDCELMHAFDSFNLSRLGSSVPSGWSVAGSWRIESIMVAFHLTSREFSKES
jgi:hypothetical protein